MNNGTEIGKKRAALLEKEQDLLTSIDHQSDELEEKLGKALKTSAIVGLGFLAGYVVYKMMEPEDKKSKKKIKPSSPKKSSSSVFSKNIVSTLVKNSLPLVLSYIEEFTKKNGKEGQSAK